MIEIIKPGKGHIAHCYECGCEFKFDPEDVTIKKKYDTWVDSLGNYHSFLRAMLFEIGCPFCHRTVNIDESDFTNEEIISMTYTKRR